MSDPHLLSLSRSSVQLSTAPGVVQMELGRDGAVVSADFTPADIHRLTSELLERAREVAA